MLLISSLLTSNNSVCFSSAPSSFEREPSTFSTFSANTTNASLLVFVITDNSDNDLKYNIEVSKIARIAVPIETEKIIVV